MSFDDSLRELTIAPTGSSFDVHVKGTKYVKGAESIVISNVDGNHYIYYSSAGVLTETTTFGPSIFEGNALVSIVYWNTSNQKAAYFADERHGLVMDGATHGYLHTVFGARYLSGYALQSFVVDGDGTLGTQAQFQADSGSIRDEDLIITSLATSTIPVLYRQGLLWRKKTADSFPLIYNGTAGYTGTNIAYNEFTGGAWQLTEVIDNNYVLIHVFATNDYNTPVIAVLGTTSYANIPEARLGADTEITSISGLPFAEFVAVGSVIFQTNSAYTNTPKAIVRSADAGEEYVDFRGEQLYTPSGVATSHSLLSNLSSDDHLQYFNESRGDARYVRDGENLGLGEEVFKQKLGTDLQFKTIVAGTNVTLTPDADTITISSTDTGEVNTASNLGLGEEVFKQKVGVDFEFKTLVAGSNVTLTPSADSVTISSIDTGEVNTASNLGLVGEGVFAQKTGVDLEFKKLKPGTNVSFSSDAESITINSTGGGGGSGAGDLDTMYSEPFDDSTLSGFTQVGLILDSSSPLNGSKSAKLIHQPLVNQSFKKIIPVPLKYRGQSMTVTVVAKSAALIGNVTILFRDETNAIDIQSSQQIQAESVSKTFQYGVKIPSNCLSFSYTITALPQAGLVETFIDDIAIKSYWTGTASQGQTEHSYTVPKITVQSSVVNVGIALSAVAVLTGATATTKGSDLYTYNSVTGIYTALKDFELSITAKATSASSNPVMVKVVIGGNTYSSGMVANGAGVGWEDSASWSGSIITGTTFYGYLTNGSIVAHVVSVLATAYESETKTIISNDLVPAKAMNGSTSIDVPKITTQSSALVQNVTIASGLNVTGALTESVGSGVFLYNASTGVYTAQKSANIHLSAMLTPSANAYAEPVIYKNSTILAFTSGVSLAGYGTSTSANFSVVAGDTFRVVVSSNSCMSQRITVVANAFETESKTWSSTQTLITEDQDSAISIVGASGYGSVSTTTRRFLSSGTTIRGNAITIEDSPTLGTRFIANKAGIYNVSYSDTQNAGAVDGAIIIAIDGNGKSYGRVGSEAGEYSDNTMWTGYLSVGQVVTCVQSSTQSTANSEVYFSMSHQGSVKAIQTVSDQKIEIPTSELRFEGASTRGLIATAIVKFDEMTKIRGDAFSVTNDINNGTFVTMKKSGKLNVSTSVLIVAGASVSITRNQSNLTSFYSSGPETLSTQGSSATVNATSTSWTGDVVVGDIIRVGAESIPSATVRTSFNLSFQEQTVAVSVSNTLPQFSDEDIIVKAWGHNNQALTMGVTDIPFQNISEGGNGAWNGTTYTVPRDGIVNIDGMVHHASGLIGINLFVNGSIHKRITNAYDTITIHKFSLNEHFTKGQVLSFRLSEDGATTLVASSILYHYLNITMRGRPTVTGVDVTPFINIAMPQASQIIGKVMYGPAIAAAGWRNYTGTGSLVYNGNSLSYNESTKEITLPFNGDYELHSAFNYGVVTTGSLGMAYEINGIQYLGASIEAATPVDTGVRRSAFILIGATAGTKIKLMQYTGGSYPTTEADIIVKLISTKTSDTILTEPETFSTDTAKIQYAGSSQYSLATLSDAPVGTFITFTMAATTNTRTQTNAAPPSQTPSQVNSNGMQITTRGFNATSTSADACCWAMQIGKGHKGISLGLYKSNGKVTIGETDNLVLGATVERGLTFQSYNEITGVLLVDAGTRHSGSTTDAQLLFSDITTQNFGYLVVNASKNPALVGIGTNDVAARGVSSTGQVISALTTVTWNSTKTYDTHGALNTATGVFTAPESGYYAVNAGLVLNSASWSTGQAFWIGGIKNGVAHGTGAQNRAWSVITMNVGAAYSDHVYLAKGDTFLITATAERGATTLYSALSDYNYFSIKKI